MASPPSSATAFLLLSLSALFVISPVHSLTCTSQSFTNNAVYKQCLDLPRLSSYLHWTYDQSNSSLSIAFIAPPPKSDGWIAWAINPTGTGMKGAQTLLAFKSNGDAMNVKTYNIEEIGPITESKISFEVWDLSAESDGGVMRLFAKVKVPGNAQTVNQVWQVGPSITAGLPDQHELQTANLNAKSTLSLVGEQMASPSGGDSRTKMKHIHGTLNVVSWGIQFPIGAIVARYMRTFESADPAWFYLHVLCQVSAYAIGVAGWGIGLKLGSESEGSNSLITAISG